MGASELSLLKNSVMSDCSISEKDENALVFALFFLLLKIELKPFS